MAESSDKTVLLSYLERNKKITIPANTPKSDLEYLREIFLTNFKFESNVLLDITIQRFDADFSDFIDLEDGDEVFHKDKLKAVVTPILAQDTPEPSSACSESSTCTKSTPSGISTCRPKQIIAVGESSGTHSSIDELSDEDEIVPRPSTRKRSGVRLDSESDNDLDLDAADVQTSDQPKEEKKYKRFKFNKSKEDSIPLPDPFELPKNFRPDVAAALASGKMTLETKTFFLSTIAGAMFTYKRYPTSNDYANVARAICAKYPFMKVPTGKPYDAIVKSLQGRFKERRRDKKPRKARAHVPSEPLHVKPKAPCVKEQDIPAVPAGEDENSFERHNRSLKAEYSKANRNGRMVDELMERTFPMRRQDILAQGHSYDPVSKYPFLQVADQMLAELWRIFGHDVVPAAKLNWQALISDIVKQARLERGARITKAVSELLDDEDNSGNSVTALCLLCYLLPDSRSKPDHKRIILFCDVTDDIKVIAQNNQSEPYVIVVGSNKNPEQAFLVMDRKILTEINPEEIPVYLIAVFYVFNICYPAGCNNFYCFLEVSLLGLKEPSISIPPAVSNLLAHLAAVSS